MWDLKPFSIYALFSQEKSYLFNVRFETLLHTCSMFTIKKVMFPRKKLFFQCGIWSPFVYILYVSKKKSYVFSMWDLKLFSIYTLCSQEKSYFLNVDLKPFRIYTLCHKKKVMSFQYRIKKSFGLNNST